MNMKSKSDSYAAAGVDITAGYKAVELMKKHIARTKNDGCLDDVGGFGGCFGLPVAGMEEPVLVSGTDGCGTKVKMAILMDKHDTIGIDAVAMCVNDIPFTFPILPANAAMASCGASSAMEIMLMPRL